MTLIRRSSPFGDLVSLRQAMDRLFEDSFVNPRTWSGMAGGEMAPMDVYATGDDVVVEVSLPGVKPDEVDITVEGSTLTIQGETKSTRQDGEGSSILQEIRRGRFTRTLTLPQGLEPERATAEFEDGILTLRLPKAEQVKPHQIKINADGKPARPLAPGEQQ